MSLDIALTSTTYQVGNRQWLLDPPDVKLNGTLDVTKFNAGTHYPNGFIPSGIAVGIVTATGLLGPYTSGASDGTQTFYGLLFDDATVLRPNGSAAGVVGVAVCVYDCLVSQARLPFQSGTGSVDSAAKTAVPTIKFVA